MSLRSTLSNVGADADSILDCSSLDAGITDACRAVDRNTRETLCEGSFDSVVGALRDNSEWLGFAGRHAYAE